MRCRRLGASRAIAELAKRPLDLVLADVRLSDGDGFEVLAHCQKNYPQTTVVLITGYATIETGIDALRAGAFDLLTKPLIDEELSMAIDGALAQREVIAENQKLKAQLDLRFGLENIVGHDHRMQRVFDMVDRIADTKATVLVTGESGTGKSLLAGRFIAAAAGGSSRLSRWPAVRCRRRCWRANCLAMRRAFTGAIGDRIGKFKQADKGTIFLDEISTASPGLQVKLLRVLQEFEFEPVGSTKTQHVDTRVILATNEDLAARSAGAVSPGPVLPGECGEHRTAATAGADFGYSAFGGTLSASDVRGGGEEVDEVSGGCA